MGVGPFVVDHLDPGGAMTLVETLRRMLGVAPDQYTVGDTAYWTDAQLQAVLDDHVSARLIQLPIQLASSTDAQGRIVQRHGQIPRFAGTLDTPSVVITDIRGVEIGPDTYTVEPDGRIKFDDDQRSSIPHASALAYDLNAAAAEICDAWAAALSSAYDVSMDGQSLKRSQAADAIAQRAATFRAKALPKTVRLTRRDVAGRRQRTLASRLAPWFDQWGRR
jgi:hypothetical protein